MSAGQPNLIRLGRPRRIERWNRIFAGMPIATLAFLFGIAMTAGALELATLWISEMDGGCGSGRQSIRVMLGMLMPCLGIGWGLNALLAHFQWPQTAAKLSLIAATTAWLCSFFIVNFGRGIFRQ